MPTRVDALPAQSDAAARGSTESKGHDDDDDNAICCERFDPTTFDDKEVVWDNKPFVVEKARCFLYVPINFGAAVARAMAALEAANAKPSGTEFVTLSDCKSPWSTTIYVAAETEPIPGAEVTHLSGRYLTKVFEGPYSNCGNFVKEMEKYLAEKEGVGTCKAKELLFYYTTCPECAKKYGKCYSVIFAKLE
jgi:hypothetical protein